MDSRMRQISDLDTLHGLLLALTALSGEFPTPLVNRLPGTDAYLEKLLKRLKSENLLRTYYRNGLRGLRLTAAAKKQLAAACPDRFAPLFCGDTVTNAPKYTVPHRLRLHRMAEVLVTMYNAGALLFPWEKPPIFQPTPPPVDTFIPQPLYYSSREVKELGLEATKIRGSRAIGVLLTDGGIFIVYNTGSYQAKWEYKAEMRLKFLLQHELCESRLPEIFMDAEQSAVVFGSDMGRLDTLMGVCDGLSHNYFVLDGSFDHFYFLTSDHKGEAVLRLLCDLDLRETLDMILSEKLRPPDPDLPIENDAMDGDMPVLFGYTCDMPRIRRFDNALAIREESGLLICFDFQEEALRRCCGSRIKFQCLDFEACERRVFQSPESN